MSSDFDNLNIIKLGRNKLQAQYIGLNFPALFVAGFLLMFILLCIYSLTTQLKLPILKLKILHLCAALMLLFAIWLFCRTLASLTESAYLVVKHGRARWFRKNILKREFYTHQITPRDKLVIQRDLLSSRTLPVYRVCMELDGPRLLRAFLLTTTSLEEAIAIQRKLARNIGLNLVENSW